MAEYIEREALLKHAHIGMTRVSDTEWQKGYWDGVDDMAEYIREEPAADVAEVKHGEWIENECCDISGVCSVCGAEAHYTSRFEETFDYDWEENLQSTGYEEIKEYIRTPYCSNCGARMDGEGE